MTAIFPQKCSTWNISRPEIARVFHVERSSIRVSVREEKHKVFHVEHLVQFCVMFHVEHFHGLILAVALVISGGVLFVILESRPHFDS